MAIGTTAAIIGSAVVGAGASALSASKNSKAINNATDAQTQSNAQSVALQRDVFNQNKETLSPFVNRGNVAGDQINALLGLGGQQAQPAPQPNALAQFRGGPNPADYYGVGDGSVFTGQYGSMINSAGGYDLPEQATGAMGVSNAFQTPASAAQPAQPTQAGQSPQQAAENAFDIFRNSTGYQFRLGEGMDAVNSGYAGAGTLQSGAALEAIIEHGQNFASNEFGNYMGQLGQQQGIGLSAAGAQAGVGLNYANNVSNLNQQNANALSNAAVAKANNSNALIGNIAGGINYGAGLFAQQQQPPAPTNPTGGWGTPGLY